MVAGETAPGVPPGAANEHDESGQDHCSSDSGGGGWICVNADYPCPHCGETRRCSIAPDGTACLCRTEEANEGEPDLGTLGLDAAWYHWIDDDGDHDHRRRARDMPPGPKAAPARDLDRVYRALLGRLILLPQHRADLIRRGFRETVFDRVLYRSHPGPDRFRVAKGMVEEFGEELLRTVPGFYAQPEGKAHAGEWTLGGWSGLLIPVLDGDGRIVALKVRCDDNLNGGKYQYLTSSSHGGPRVDAPVHFPANYLLCECYGWYGFTPESGALVRITEGELKADLSVHLSGVATYSIPGVKHWQRALPVLVKRLARSRDPIIEGLLTVRIALDADRRRNLGVALAQRGLVEGFLAAGFRVELEVWDETQPDGTNTKGIDDLLAAGLEPTVLSGDEMDEEMERIMAAAKAAGATAAGTAGEAGTNGAQGAKPDASKRYYSLHELEAKMIPPQQWAIPDLIPQGLSVLAGAPKMYKSWLALAMGRAISDGSDIFGCMPVVQGGVLYYALEDSERRMQDRSRKMIAGGTWPTGVIVSHSLSRLDKGGLEEIAAALTDRPEIRLVIIDVWARIKPPKKAQGDPYEQETAVGASLKAVADTHGVAILLIHHTRKQYAEDPFDMIRGEGGLVGVADALMVLRRERGSLAAELHVTGRDMQERSGENAFGLRWEESQWQWVLTGTAALQRMSPERRAVFQVIAQSGGSLSSTEVAKRLGEKETTIRSLMTKMAKAGQLVNVCGSGQYAVNLSLLGR